MKSKLVLFWGFREAATVGEGVATTMVWSWWKSWLGTGGGGLGGFGEAAATTSFFTLKKILCVISVKTKITHGTTHSMLMWPINDHVSR